MRAMRSVIRSTGVGAGLLCAVAFGPNGVGEEVSRLEEVVVTATRTETQAGRVGGTTFSVVTAEDIAAKGQVTVEEVLKGVPGVDVVASGGSGTATSIFIRGAASKDTLVLVDGVMLNDPAGTNRSANLSMANLTVDNIERIEVVRGPVSALYGSNATSGVINIITKRGKDRPSGYVGAEGGSYGMWKVYAGSSGGNERVDYSLSLSRLGVDGFSTANDANDDIPHAGNTDEEDGWENTSVSANVGVTLAPNVTLRGTLRYTDSEVYQDDWGPGGHAGDQFGDWREVPPGSGTWVPPGPMPDGLKKQRTESDELTGRLELQGKHFDSLLDSTLYMQRTAAEQVGFNANGVQDSRFEGDTMELGWQGGLNIGDTNRLTLGVSRFEEEMKTTWVQRKDAHLTSYWVQDQWFPVEGADLVAGGRIDDHERYGDEFTYRVAPAYTFSDTGTTLKASYGTGFRAPSLFELYSDYGDPDLEPEESEGWDVGVVQRLMEEKVRAGVTYFNMEYENQIQWDSTVAPFGAYAQADGVTETQGVEVFANWTPIEKLELGLTYTHTDIDEPEDAEPAVQNQALTRRAQNRIALNARFRPVDKLTVNVDVLWVDERIAVRAAKDGAGRPVGTMGSYTVVNLAANYAVTDNVTVYARVDNVFDEEYEEVWSYATPGLSAYAGVKVSF